MTTAQTHSDLRSNCEAAALALENAEHASVEGADVSDLNKVDWVKLADLVQTVVKEFSETEQFLDKRARMGVPEDRKESLETARNTVIEVMKAQRKLLSLLRTPRFNTDPTLLEFYQNAAAIDWQAHQESSRRCLDLAREMQYHAVDQVHLRGAEIEKRIADLKPQLDSLALARGAQLLAS